MVVPTGCLGCNRAQLVIFLEAHGYNPDDFEEIPRPAQAWGKVAVCRQCGKAWLIPERKKNAGKKDL